MQKEAINRRYEKLSASHHAEISIININDPEAPKCNMTEECHRTVLVINSARVPEDRYESFLAYYVSKCLLPQLVLFTERLILRRFRLEDAADCFSFLSDMEGTYMDCSRSYVSMDEEFSDLMESFAQQRTRYVITLKKTGKVIGTVNLFEDNSRAVETMEIGYAVSPQYQRKGYAFEALTALLNLLQIDLFYDLVLAGVLPENENSIGLLRKLGFEKEGIRRKAIWHEGRNRPVDLVYYYRDRES